MYRNRSKALGDSSLSRRDLILWEKYTDDFLLADIYFDADNRIIIFGSLKGLKCVEYATDIFGDGTLKCCPRL